MREYHSQTDNVIAQFRAETKQYQARTDNAITQLKEEIKEALSQHATEQRDSTAELRTAMDTQHKELTSAVAQQSELQDLTAVMMGLKDLCTSSQEATIKSAVKMTVDALHLQPRTNPNFRYLSVSISLGGGKPLADYSYEIGSTVMLHTNARHIIELIKEINRGFWRPAQQFPISEARCFSLESIRVPLLSGDTEKKAIYHRGEWSTWIEDVISYRNDNLIDINVVFALADMDADDGAQVSKKRKLDGDFMVRDGGEGNGCNVFSANGW